MTAEDGGLWIGLGLVLGAIAGSWVTLWILGARHAAALRRLRDDFQRQSDAVVDQFRIAQLRSQTEIEQLRQTGRRQLATASAEPQAALARAESRLRAAYDEIDRLRRDKAHETTIPSDLGDGFAATRPMVDGM
ncbi:MAG: hypothetical protein V4844_20995 [Pseudomonadota bacterium]